MLSRKQKWRRVKCSNTSARNRRGECTGAPANTRYIVVETPPQGGGGGDAAPQFTPSNKPSDIDNDENGTISTSWSSFDSVESVLQEEVEEIGDDYDDDVLAMELAAPGLSTSPDDCLPLPATDGRRPATSSSGSNSDSGIKGVTFEPRVQVFLVTHKSELDTRSKQALWWTGRDAAINKRAWLSHLGQPGCGRQSANRPLCRPRAPSADLAADDDDVDLLLGDGLLGGGGGTGHFRPSHEQQQSQSVGILGCRCLACQTEGDDYDHPSPSREYLAYSAAANGGRSSGAGGGYYSAADPMSYARVPAGSSKSWPPETCDWRRDVFGTRGGRGGRHGSEELGSRSFSPASQSTSPLHDANADADVFSNAYFWGR